MFSQWQSLHLSENGREPISGKSVKHDPAPADQDFVFFNLIHKQEIQGCYTSACYR